MSANEPQQRSKGWVASVTNFSIQYNLTCASTAIALIKEPKKGGLFPPEPVWAEKILLASVFGGTLVGMLTMGTLGDRIGCKRAMFITQMLTLLATLCCAFVAPWWAAGAGDENAAGFNIEIASRSSGTGPSGIFPTTGGPRRVAATIGSSRIDEQEEVGEASSAGDIRIADQRTRRLLSLATVEQLPPNEPVERIRVRVDENRTRRVLDEHVSEKTVKRHFHDAHASASTNRESRTKTEDPSITAPTSSTTMDANIFYGVFTVGRFFLGWGVGGMYPLGAEQSISKLQDASPAEIARKAGFAFLWQTPGVVFPYVVCLALLVCMGGVGTTVSSLLFQFQVVVAFGAVPCLLVVLEHLFFSWREEDPREMTQFLDSESTAIIAAPTSSNGGASTTKQTPTSQTRSHSTPSPSDHREGTRSSSHSLNSLLLASGGSWLLFDVSMYGTSVFAPFILEKILPPDAPLTAVCTQTILSNLVSVVGAVLSVYHIAATSCRDGMTLGFALMTVAFALFALQVRTDVGGGYLALILYYIVLLCCQFGPNVATYVLPMVCFPKERRVTFHGRSAACGKIGAVAGTLLYPLFLPVVGVPGVMAIQAVVCFLGYLLADRTIPK
ncbi:unnamed protein product [Amoebophrya sp. A25]|nr:unnamed protein product [Amoebophrya sp. A25]|eukprot:GSA25T00025723001.1